MGKGKAAKAAIIGIACALLVIASVTILLLKGKSMLQQVPFCLKSKSRIYINIYIYIYIYILCTCIYGKKYSRMDQAKFVEDSLICPIWNMVCFRQTPFKFFKRCLPQILLGSFLNIFSHM